MINSSARNSGKFIVRDWRYAVGWLLAAAGLIWVLHGVHPSRLPGQLAGIDWRWIALAMVCDVTRYLVQAMRWQLLLEPVGKINLLQAMQAIYAGLFTNEVLPLLIIGFLALSRSGLSLAAIREELRQPEPRADL